MGRMSRRGASSPPEHPQYPEEIAGFIHDVHALRTTMASDLSAAAGAVESDEPGVASDFIEGGRGDLASLGLRGSDPDTPAAEVPAQPGHRRARSGARTVMVATIPLLATAALGAGALVAFTGRGGPPRPHPVHAQIRSPGGSVTSPTAQAAATLAALSTDVRRGASPATIAARAALLRDELARLISTERGDHRIITKVRRMLATEDHLLSGYADPQVTLQLRSVRQLEASLNRTAATSPVAAPTAPPSPVSTTVSHRPAPPVAPTRKAVHHSHPPASVQTPTASPPATSPPLPLPTISPVVP